MKPKYYSCFFLSLFACGKENTEIQNVAINDNFFKSLNAIYKENDTTQYTGHVLKLVKSYDSSFGNLEECEKIFKQLCELKQPYTTQAIYDVLYALLENKCISSAEVQLILQHIKDNFENSYSLLNNFVFTKFNTYAKKNIDSSAKTIIDFFYVNSQDFIQIPQKEKFQINNIEIDNALELENFTNIYQCVRYINLNENNFTKKSLEKLIILDNKGGSFNNAIQGVYPLFKGSGDDMMDCFENKIVNLDDEGLNALAKKINGSKITNINSLKYLFPSLKNCTNLKPILDKYKNAVNVDSLSELLEKCPENCLDLINSIPKWKVKNKTRLIEKVISSTKNEAIDKNKLNKIVDFCIKYVNKPVQNSKEYDYCLGLIDKSVDLNDGESCNELIKILSTNNEILDILNKLVKYYNNNVSEKINKVLSLSDPNTFGDGIISFVCKNNIVLDKGNLIKILSRNNQKISNCSMAIEFCCDNIKNLDNENNIKTVFDKVNDKSFGFSDLKKLWVQGEKDNFNKILSCIPVVKFKQDNASDSVIEFIIDTKIELDEKTIPNVLSMIGKISDCQNAIKFCCNNIENLNDTNIKAVFDKVNDKSFDLNALGELLKQGKDNFYKILSCIPVVKFKQDNANNVLKEINKLITDKKFTITTDKLTKILLFCDNRSKIDNVDNLYQVFCSFKANSEMVKTLKERVGDLNGDEVFCLFYLNNSKQNFLNFVDFFREFYSCIKDKSINQFSSVQNCKHFIEVAHELFVLGKLNLLEKKFYAGDFNKILKKQKVSLKKLDITENCEDFIENLSTLGISRECFFKKVEKKKK